MAFDYNYYFSNSDSDLNNNLRWIKIGQNLLVCDRNIITGITGDFAESYNSTGSFQTIDGQSVGIRNLSSQEWDNLLLPACGDETAANGYLDNIIHWKNCYSWTSDYSSVHDYRIFSGFYSAKTHDSLYIGRITNGFGDRGFRPALELYGG